VSTWVRRTITLAHGYEKTATWHPKIIADVYREALAVHREVKGIIGGVEPYSPEWGLGWRLTHVGTGYAFGDPYRTKAEAKRAAVRVYRIHQQWGFTDPGVVNDLSTETKVAIKAAVGQSK
jgi:hypothetical protein